MSFERLIREHDRLERMAGELRACVLGAPVPVKALQLLRRFAVEIEEHRANERRLVYRPLRELAIRKPLPQEIKFSDLELEMDADWGNYLYDWDLELIGVDWQNFAVETTRVLDRARMRLRLENCTIYPLALQEGAIPLR